MNGAWAKEITETRRSVRYSSRSLRGWGGVWWVSSLFHAGTRSGHGPARKLEVSDWAGDGEFALAVDAGAAFSRQMDEARPCVGLVAQHAWKPEHGDAAVAGRIQEAQDSGHQRR